MSERPLAVDLCCGLGGWTNGLLAEGWDVIGFDIERHVYGEAQYPAQLVLQDMRTLHGSQFKTASLIVASPPCQEFSYMAMPWTRAKDKAAKLRVDAEDRKRLTELFDTCFRLQREASEAAGRHIPLIVENVKGAQPWVGRARWNFGSFYLWGDVPALMPIAKAAKVPGFRFDGSGGSFQTASVETSGVNCPGMNWSGSDKPGYVAKAFNGVAAEQLRDGTKWTTSWDKAIKNNGGSWFAIGSPGQKETGRNPVHETAHQKALREKVSAATEGTKINISGHAWYREGLGRVSSSSSRKAASAHIAKIPFTLSSYIARTFKP